MGNSGSRGGGGGGSGSKGNSICGIDRRDIRSITHEYSSDKSKTGTICITMTSKGVTDCFSTHYRESYPSAHSNNRGGEGRGGGSGSSSNHQESRGGGYTGQDLIIKDHSSYLQSKFATFDVGYGQIHSDAIIGINPTSRGVPFMEEVIDTIRTEVSKGTLHHKLVINAHNRELVDSDLYHLGIKLSGSTGTTTSGVTLNLCLFDLHQNNLTTYGMNNFLHFFKWQNINEINFSSNKLGDDSCRQLGQAFSASWLPHLFNIDLSNNQITDTGARYLSDPIYQGKMPKLVNLYITDNYLTYTGKEILINTVCQIQWKQKISVTVDSGISMPNTETQLILKNWCLLQNKYSGIDLGYGKIHHNPIIGESYSYKRIPFMNEVAETIKMVKDLGTLHHKLVVNAYNRELVDSDLYYLGSKITNHYDPKVIAPPTISSVTLNLCLFDLHKNNITHLGVHNFLHFFKGQNIREVNLSNNQIGDDGAKLLADSLVTGKFPHLKKLHLEGNKITTTGTGYLSKALDTVEQGLVIVLKTVQNASKSVAKFVIKEMLHLAKSNGISTKEVLTNQETIEQCKQGTWNVGKNIGYGILKCWTKLDKSIAVYEMDFQYVATALMVDIINPAKKPVQVYCTIESTVFSVVDEDFANCLTGLDSELNND